MTEKLFTGTLNHNQNKNKQTKSLVVIVYLHSETQRFFVDAIDYQLQVFKRLCRYMASGGFAIILSLMQRVMGYPLTLQNFDF